MVSPMIWLLFALLFGVAELGLTASAGEAAQRFAGPSGGGSAPCSTNSAPFCSPSTALAALNCGDTLILKDGTYIGSSGMLASGRACSSGLPITVRAENDGGAIIDGQYA